MAEYLTVAECCPRCGYHARAEREAEGRSVVESRHVTARELDVLQLVSEGRSNQQISTLLNISIRTVKAHLTSLFGKFDVASRTELIVHPEVKNIEIRHVESRLVNV